MREVKTKGEEMEFIGEEDEFIGDKDICLKGWTTIKEDKLKG